MTASDFYDLLMPELPGCTTAMVDFQLRETLRDFCMKTGVWNAQFTDITLTGIATYTLVTGVADSEVVRLTRLDVGTDLLWTDSDRSSKDNLVPKYERNEPPFTLSADKTQITLIDDEATSTDTASIQGTLKPTAAATTYPDFLKSQYSEAIRFGTLARLMVMGKKPWTDRELAVAYARQYMEQLNFAGYQAQVGNTRERLRVRKWG